MKGTDNILCIIRTSIIHYHPFELIIRLMQQTFECPSNRLTFIIGR